MKLNNLLSPINLAGQEIKRATAQAIGIVERVATRKAPSDTGALRGSARTFAAETGGFLTFNKEYAAAVHEGTRPHHPPVRAGRGLALWARRKGLNAYAVAKKIAKDGTKGNPFLQEAVNENARQINRIFDLALSKILSRI